MKLDHRVIRLVVALGFGLIVAYGSYQWITDTDRPARRVEEEAVALAARDTLRSYIANKRLADESLEISDAIDRDREAGKVYLFPTDDGWELSGHYRRQDEKDWHAFLMALDANVALISLSVQDKDAELSNLAMSDPKFAASE